MSTIWRDTGLEEPVSRAHPGLRGRACLSVCLSVCLSLHGGDHRDVPGPARQIQKADTDSVMENVSVNNTQGRLSRTQRPSASIAPSVRPHTKDEELMGLMGG